MDIFQKILQEMDTLTRGQQKIAQFILNNYKQAAFMNSVDLAAALGTSNPSVIRFAQALGFHGYQPFQRALQDAVQNDLSSVERLFYLPYDAHSGQAPSVFSLEMENIASVYEHLDGAAMDQAVQLLQGAETIFVFGRQISESVALFATYTLEKIHSDVRMVDSWTLSCETALAHHPKRCAALVIALPRYPMATLQFLTFLHQKGIPSVVITGDPTTFPLAKQVTCLIAAPVRYISFVDSIAAVYCILNSIIVAMVRQMGQAGEAALQRFEEYVEEQGIYYSNTKASPQHGQSTDSSVYPAVQKKKHDRKEPV